MPLWHNKDKLENPCVAMGWLVCPILFPLKTALKWDLLRGGEKTKLHLKDKCSGIKATE